MKVAIILIAALIIVAYLVLTAFYITLVLLPNAILSKGALLEAQYANYVGKPVYILDDWLDKPIINKR